MQIERATGMGIRFQEAPFYRRSAARFGHASGQRPSLRTANFMTLSLMLFALLASCDSPLLSEDMEGQPGESSAESIQSSEAKPPVVLELFTSQGCSSCPPADGLLSELHQERIIAGREVIALSHHVDYWNRLGWKDPYSSPQASERQQYYVRSLEARGSYTPQIVVDGRYETVGHREAEIRRLIEKDYPSYASIQLEIVQGKRNPGIRISLSRTLRKNEKIHIFLAQDNVQNPVPVGENAGRQLHHDGVVLLRRDLEGSQRIFEVDSSILPATEGEYRLVAFIQSPEGIHGAGQVAVDFPKIR
ncbi:MAG: DUF1223 domain-containing protein [Leptospiraceae bacterium]|nr:DUF1223 domain-containing protein [Leptospiraceae bacterium]